MENQIKTLFIGEIQRNCDFALLAYNDMMKYMQPNNKETLDRFWLSSELFLIAVANISKILWLLSEEVLTCRQDLRRILDVDDSSPIHSKKFRNHFEHYDERIEEWASPSKHVIFDSNIGTIQSIVRSPSNSVSLRRNFDSPNQILYVEDEPYDVGQVLRAVKDLLNKSKTIHT